jgi:hypothetical protein
MMRSMRNALYLAVFAGSLTACGTAPLSFESLSEEELYAYNAEQPLLNQVICVKEQRTSSHIRKRRCQSLHEIINERSTAGLQLQVLDYGAHYNAGMRNRRD